MKISPYLKGTLAGIVLTLGMQWLFVASGILADKQFTQTHERLLKSQPSIDLGAYDHHEAKLRSVPVEDATFPFISIYQTTPFFHLTPETIAGICVDKLAQDDDNVEQWKLLVSLKDPMPTPDDERATVLTQIRHRHTSENYQLSGLKGGLQEFPLYVNEMHALDLFYTLTAITPEAAILPCNPNDPMPLYERWRETLVKRTGLSITVPKSHREAF